MGTSTLDLESLGNEFLELEGKLKNEEESLNLIYHTLNDKRPFGLSLSEMYASSYSIPKNSYDYTVYLKLIDNPDLMSLSYKEFADALFAIKDKELEKIYYLFYGERRHSDSFRG